MNKRFYFLSILGFVAMLVFSSIALMNVGSERAVDYTKNLTDPSGDVTGQNAAGDFRDDADITAVKSSESTEVITLQLIVVGKIHLTSNSLYQGYYYWEVPPN